MSDRWREISVAPRRSQGEGTIAFLIATAALYLVTMTSWRAASLLATGSSGSFAYEYWRPLLFGLTTSSFLQLIINGVCLWFMGAQFEDSLGRANYLVLLLLSGLGGATALTLAGPAAALGGSTFCIFGLIAAYAVHLQHARMDYRGQVALLVLLVLWGVLAGGNMWIGDIGAITVGGAVGAVYVRSPWRDRNRHLALGYAVIAVLCLGALTAKWMMLG